jgi:hypothetical protein
MGVDSGLMLDAGGVVQWTPTGSDAQSWRIYVVPSWPIEG